MTAPGRDGPFSGFPNMMGNLINTLQRDGYTDRVIHYVADACRDHESLVARAALADRLAEALKDLGRRFGKLQCECDSYNGFTCGLHDWKQIVGDALKDYALLSTTEGRKEGV